MWTVFHFITTRQCTPSTPWCVLCCFFSSGIHRIHHAAQEKNWSYCKYCNRQAILRSISVPGIWIQCMHQPCQDWPFKFFRYTMWHLNPVSVSQKYVTLVCICTAGIISCFVPTFWIPKLWWILDSHIFKDGLAQLLPIAGCNISYKQRLYYAML